MVDWYFTFIHKRLATHKECNILRNRIQGVSLYTIIYVEMSKMFFSAKVLSLFVDFPKPFLIFKQKKTHFFPEEIHFFPKSYCK